MHDDYMGWLKGQGYQGNTCGAQLHRVKKVEEHYGVLDDLIRDGQFGAVISELTYSTADERRNRPNPSRIQFEGNIRNNLQSYKNAARGYERFWNEKIGLVSDTASQPEAMLSHLSFDNPAGLQNENGQRLALERDMQAALRLDIEKLEAGLTITDGGAEQSVQSGFIDILCRDIENQTVVVELKAGKTDPRVMGQILGYMGDLMEDEPEEAVRGVIVAHEFDRRTLSAARAAPNVKLVTYSIEFSFRSV